MYRRDGKDLYCTVQLTDTALRNGSKAYLPPLAGRELKAVNIPAETPARKRLRLGGGGVPGVTKGKPAGDMYVTVKLEAE